MNWISLIIKIILLVFILFELSVIDNNIAEIKSTLKKVEKQEPAQYHIKTPYVLINNGDQWDITDMAVESVIAKAKEMEK